MIHPEDREIISQAMTLGAIAIVSIVLGLIMLAAALGLAWRIFEMLGGL